MQDEIKFYGNDYNKFANRLTRFLKILGREQYALVGSGSCTKKIVRILQDKNYVMPVGAYDNQSLGETIGPYQVESLENIPEEVNFILIGSLGFEIEIKRKTEDVLGERFKAMHVACFADFSEYRKERVSKHPLIINAMPKSASYFIQNSIEKALDIDHQGIAEGKWPKMNLSESNLNLCMNTCRLSVSHLQANSRTLDIMKYNNISKMAVHVRDPRQATLSWIHHLDKTRYKGNFTPGFFSIDNYFELDFDAKINYQIYHFLPQVCQYILSWMEVGSTAEFDIKFVSFSQMKNDPENFFQQLYDFFEVEGKFHTASKPEPGELHYRKGLEDEWRQVFSPSQIKAANQVLPKELKSRFGWID